MYWAPATDMRFGAPQPRVARGRLRIRWLNAGSESACKPPRVVATLPAGSHFHALREHAGLVFQERLSG